MRGQLFVFELQRIFCTKVAPQVAPKDVFLTRAEWLRQVNAHNSTSKTLRGYKNWFFAFSVKFRAPKNP